MEITSETKRRPNQSRRFAQLSLATLLLSIALLGVSLTAARLYPYFPPEDAVTHVLILNVGLSSLGAGIGGLFGRIGLGAVLGLAVALLGSPMWYFLHAAAAC